MYIKWVKKKKKKQKILEEHFTIRFTGCGCYKGFIKDVFTKINLNRNANKRYLVLKHKNYSCIWFYFFEKVIKILQEKIPILIRRFSFYIPTPLTIKSKYFFLILSLNSLHVEFYIYFINK